ncbi:MAG: hypothetical protein ACYCTY_15720 [Sulfuricella sp.]
MNTVEWSTKATRQLRKIADKSKRQGIYAESQQLAHWPNCPGSIIRLQGREHHQMGQARFNRTDDDMVLECAVASGSQFIVTHNMKNFRRVEELKVQAIKPADFLRLLRSRP